jgi:hypothetical protein
MGENQIRQNPYVFKLIIQVGYILEKVGDMGLFSAHIWHNSPLLYNFYHLSGRNNSGLFILAEKVVFSDYLT